MIALWVIIDIHEVSLVFLVQYVDPVHLLVRSVQYVAQGLLIDSLHSLPNSLCPPNEGEFLTM